MTFNAVCLKQPVDPKAVQSSFLDHHNLHRTPRQLLSPRPHTLQQTEQRATIAARRRILRHPVPFGQQAGDKPRCSTQFQRRIERQIGTVTCGLLSGSMVDTGEHRFLLDA